MLPKFDKGQSHFIKQSSNRINVKVDRNTTIQAMLLNKLANSILQFYRELAASIRIKLAKKFIINSLVEDLRKQALILKEKYKTFNA